MNKLNKFDKAQQNKDLASINSNGEGFISQRATAHLCGVDHKSIKHHLDKNPLPHFNTNEFNQLDYEGCLYFARYYMVKGKPQAQQFYNWLIQPDNTLANIKDYKYIRPTKAPKSSKGFVYLIKCNEWYKIGKAKNVNSRLSGLQTGSPYLLELLHAIHCKDYTRAESYLHNVFADRRGLGEWFELTESDIEKIKAIKTL